MMRRRTAGYLVALAAFLVSGGLHALVLAQGAAPPSTLAPGGGAQAAQPMLLGNDFADLAAGGARPVAPETARPITPEPLAPVLATDLPAPAVPPAAPALLAPAAPTVPRLEPRSDAAPETSARPRARPARETAPPAKIATPPAPRSQQAAGASTRDARRGQAQGTELGRSDAAQGKPAAAPGPGNQLSPQRYAATVIRKIRSTPQRRGSGRGMALVAFEIGAGGQLLSLRILRGSGSSTLDAAALDHIRRAAPFPPPPARPARFSFEFVARG